MTARVAVTRPEPMASGTADRLTDLGFVPLKAPLFTLVPGEGPGDPSGIGAIALTSRNGARCLACDPRFHALPVFAVGRATATQAQRAGFGDVRSADGDMEALLHALRDAPEPIVHMCGDAQAGDLVGRLLARGQQASRRILYRMAPVAALPSPGGPLAAVLLYSPRAAAALAERASGPWCRATCVALSPAVAAPLGGRRCVVAARPDEEALLEALCTVLPAPSAAGAERP